MPKQNQQPTSEIEEAREIIRELHGVLKDIRQERRILEQLLLEVKQEAVMTATDIVKPMQETLESELEKYAAELQEALSQSNKNFQQSIATMANQKSPDDFMLAIIAELVNVLGPRINKLITESIEQEINKVKVELRDLKRRK